MSRNLLKNFRRKSSGNALDLQAQQDTTKSEGEFKVFVRPEKAERDPRNRASTVLPGGKATAYPLQRPAVRSADNLGSNLNRYGGQKNMCGTPNLIGSSGSGGTTNSAGSGYYETSGSSARHSSSSTLPSSLEADHDVDGGDLFSTKKTRTAPSLVAAADSPQSFTARAGRALSFGLKNPRHSHSTPVIAVPYTNHNSGAPPVMTRTPSDESTRDRAMTASSYASTAKPPQLDNSLGSADLGGDFGNMFQGMSKQIELPPVPPLPQNVTKVQSSERFGRASPVDTVQSPEEALFPPRSSSRGPNGSPSPTLLEQPKSKERRFSWDSRKSNEQLMSGDSSGLNSPSSELFPVSGKPAGAAALTSMAAIRGYQPVSDRYASPEPTNPRDSPTSNSGFLSAQSHRAGTPVRENLPSRMSEDRLAWSNEPQRTSVDDAEPRSSSRLGMQASGYGVGARHRPAPSTTDIVLGPRTSINYEEDPADRTPRARKSIIQIDDSHALGSSPAGPSGSVINPTRQRPAVSDTPKKMTRQQFEQAKRARNSIHIEDDDSKSEESDVDDYEDEDEAEKQKKMTAQRRKQEASMSVYRQQMKKVTAGGGSISDLPTHHATTSRPLTDRSSMPNLAPGLSSSSGTVSPAEPEEDDDVPLGILQAHGFPSKTRPPTHPTGTQPGYAHSVAGDVGRSGNLPAFARRLPQDPYFGAGLVNPAQREALAFNSSGSAYSGPISPQPPVGPPGGLVGVIANEERAKAGRRGGPTTVTGGYGPIPLPSNMMGNPQMPGFSRQGSMASLHAPHAAAMGGFYPQNGLAPMTPMEQANINTQQQMAQLMQMQTQMMQQMMVMQSGQMTGQMPQMAYPFPTPQPGMPALPSQANGLLQTPAMTPSGPNQSRPISTISIGRPGSLAGQGRSMTMMQPPSNWNADNNQTRTNTMGNRPRANYAGSVLGVNSQANGPGPGYTPSIAPSERSNIGMPSRYRPVSIVDGANQNPGDRRSKTMTATSFNPHSLGPMPRSPTSPLNPTHGNAQPAKPKSTIRIIDKLRSQPKTNTLRPDRAEDEDDDAGWSQLAKKREAMRTKRANKNPSNEIAELYQGLDN